MADPVLLENGDVLAPVRLDNGVRVMARVEVGDEEHIKWVELIQGQTKNKTRSNHGGTAVAVFVGALLAFFAVWGLAQANPDHIAVPVKFFVSQDRLDSITGGADSSAGTADPYAADGDCLGSSDVTADDFDPDC